MTVRDPIVFPSTSLGLLRGQDLQFNDGDVNHQLVFGVNRYFNLPSGYYTRVLSITYHTDISAALGNRFFGHRIDDGINPYLVYHAPQAWGPSHSSDYTAHINLAAQSGFIGAAAEMGPLPNVWLPGGWRIGSDMLGLSTSAPLDHVFSFRVLCEAVTEDEIRAHYDRIRQDRNPHLTRSR